MLKLYNFHFPQSGATITLKGLMKRFFFEQPVLDSLLTLAFSSKQQPDLNLFTTQPVQPNYRFDCIPISLVPLEKSSSSIYNHKVLDRQCPVSFAICIL